MYMLLRQSYLGYRGKGQCIAFEEVPDGAGGINVSVALHGWEGRTQVVRYGPSMPAT